MIAKMQNNFKNRKLYSSMIAFATIFVILMVIMVGVNVFGALGNKKSATVTSVTLNGKTYDVDHPYVIYEIVPQEGLAELGYMVGGDSMPILASDIKQINDSDKRDKVYAAWKNAIACFTWDWNSSLYDNDGNIQGYEDRNILANSIFGNSKMSDKIIVKTVKAKDVTETMINEADMVYVNTGNHNSAITNAYNIMADNSIGTAGLSKTYNKYTGVTYKSNNYSNNIKAEVALQIYLRSVKDGMEVIFENGQIDWNSISSNDNYSKLGILFLGIEPNTFVTEYASSLSGGVYSGSKGSIRVNKNNNVLELRRGNELLGWDGKVFIEDENKTSKYPYFNCSIDARHGMILEKNLLSVYDSGLFMGENYLYKSCTLTDRDSNNNNLGTSFDEARDLFDIEAGGNLSYPELIRYIIGDSPSEEDFDQIKVLEIEPSGAYQYCNSKDNDKNYKSAVMIANYLGYDTNIITPDNWSRYVNVKSVASNGFNGMNEDIAENYDLVIVGSNNPDGYLKLLSTKIYSLKGEETEIRNINRSTNFSGNDLTMKSVGKLTEYAQTGKPLVLSQDLYYGSSKIDSSANIYDLSIVNLRVELEKAGVSDKNIMHEPNSNASSRYLTRMVKPVITIDSSFKMKYNGDVATTTVSADSISNLDFWGKIGNTAKTYDLVVAVDKDSNGLFTTDAMDDTNEVYYNEKVTTASDGTFHVNLQLPASLRGYIAWKAVVKDSITKISSEDFGGFVVEVRPEDVKTVKLLQIMPVPRNGVPISLDMTNSDFQRLFAPVEAVSGIKLDVTKITTREFENMYKGYGNNYKAGIYDTNNMLKNYSMVVVGFADSYGADDISNNNGALDNLKDFIKQGNSVLFTHDTMSYSAYSDGSTTWDGKTSINYGDKIRGSTGSGGYQLTDKFRSIIGMDRYGASTNPPNSSAGDNIQGLSNTFLFKYARDKFSIFKDVPLPSSNYETEKVNRLNQGQVTEFPYQTDENLTVAQTHGQWFQLNLEGQSNIADDVVVWYTLGSDTINYPESKYYDYTGQDAVNNYYIYSKGNVTYSGAGHKLVNDESELKLFVNTVIRAILSGNSAPEITVNNAFCVSAGKYELYSRELEDSGDIRLPVVKFTPLDRDMSRSTGKFESGLVYWDVDGNGSFDDRIDVRLKEYAKNELVNAPIEPIEIKLTDYKDFKNKNSSSNNTLQYCFNTGQLKIGIQATDSTNATGSASVTVRYRKLFNLE